MKRVQGSENIGLIECVNPRIRKYVVRWDIKPYYQHVEGKGEILQGVDYYEKWFNHKPQIEEIKNEIISQMNEMIDEKIVSGFSWKDMPIWLSTENQFNYKAAYDLAVQTQGATLPVTFKFGTTDAPVYYKFETVTDLTDFYIKAMTYINETLNEGWMKKDSIDWTEYIKLLEEK